VIDFCILVKAPFHLASYILGYIKIYSIYRWGPTKPFKVIPGQGELS
jgi:hypothetical protein